MRATTIVRALAGFATSFVVSHLIYYAVAWVFGWIFGYYWAATCGTPVFIIAHIAVSTAMLVVSTAIADSIIKDDEQ